jgi:hypothetical protein
MYTYIFQSDQTAFQQATPEQLEVSVKAARDEADAWQTPLWIGEFGCGPDDDAAHDLWMRTQYQLADRYLASNAFWVWKEIGMGSWGMYTYDATAGTFTERPNMVARVSRVHAARIAGTPTVVESTPIGDAIHVERTPGSAGAAPDLVYIPERFAATTKVRCDGVELAAPRDAATGLVSVACTGVLDVGP